MSAFTKAVLREKLLLLSLALRYAERGWPVLPCWWISQTVIGRCACGAEPGACKPGKHPIGKLVPHGLDDASTDPNTIRRWFGRGSSYALANVAVRTGPESGLLVLDVDGLEGERSVAALEQRYSPLPEFYPMQWTGGGRGGWQAFFAYPAGRQVGNSVGRLGTGLDTRGNRGYVVVPPSITTGPYRWDAARSFGVIKKLPQVPLWLVDLLDPPTPPEPDRDAWPVVSVAARGNGDRYALKALESELALVAVAPTGRRNDQLNSSAHALFRFVEAGQLPADVIHRGLLAAALHAGLSEREALATISSAAKARGVAS